MTADFWRDDAILGIACHLEVVRIAGFHRGVPQWRSLRSSLREFCEGFVRIAWVESLVGSRRDFLGGISQDPLERVP